MGDNSDDDYLPSSIDFDAMAPIGVDFQAQLKDVDLATLTKWGEFLRLVAGFANLQLKDVANLNEESMKYLFSEARPRAGKEVHIHLQGSEEMDREQAQDVAERRVAALQDAKKLTPSGGDRTRNNVTLKSETLAAIDFAFQRLHDNNALPVRGGEKVTHENFIEKFVLVDQALYRAPFAKLVALQMSVANYNTPGRYYTNNQYRVLQRQERAIIARFKRDARNSGGDSVLRAIDSYVAPDLQDYNAARW